MNTGGYRTVEIPCEGRPVLRETAPTQHPVKFAALLPKTRQSFFRWLKFNFVGGIGIGVQLAALAILRSGFHIDYLLATALAVELAVVHNFLWHERYTWVDRPSGSLRYSLLRLAKFNVSNGAVSLLGNLLMMRLLVGEFHVNYAVANLAAIAVCSLANFLLSDRLVFQQGLSGNECN